MTHCLPRPNRCNGKTVSSYFLKCPEGMRLSILNLFFILMSNTRKLNREDYRHRRPESAEVRSRNRRSISSPGSLSKGREEERPWKRGGRGCKMFTNRHDPSQQNSTRLAGSQLVNKILLTTQTEEKGNQMTYKCTCIPRFKPQTSNGHAYQCKKRVLRQEPFIS